MVTGLGVQSSLGNASESWLALIERKSGIKSIKGLEGFDKLPCNVGGVVSEFVTGPRHIAFGLSAAEEALKSSEWDCNLGITGVSVGSGIGSISEIHSTAQKFDSGGYRKVSPFFVPRILCNMAGGHISIKYKCTGPIHSASTACATGLHCIGDAMRFIQLGQATTMIAGGTESCIDPLSFAGFIQAKSLCTNYNDFPAKASRPFDSERSGFVIAEGAAIVILEELEQALNRKASIYAEVVGYGLSADAYHITAPNPNGSGAMNSMLRALKDAEIRAEEVSYINAHATSTIIGDAAEAKAISNIFPKSTRVSSTKGSTGHLLGGAGAIEAIFTILAIQNGEIPPNLNLDSPAYDLNFQTGSYDIPIALCNSFGFGGTNSTLCFKRYP